MLLFFATMEGEYRPVMCTINRDPLPHNIGNGSAVLLRNRDKIYRGTIVSDIFHFDDQHIEMLKCHYGYNEFPLMVGTYSYQESYFETPEP